MTIIDFILGNRKYVAKWIGEQSNNKLCCYGLAENGMGYSHWDFYSNRKLWIVFSNKKEAIKFMDKNCIEDKVNYVIMELKDAN